jgi:hypothetical protein
MSDTFQGGDWGAWDKMLMEYKYANNDAAEWATDVDNFSLSNMPDLGSANRDMDLANMMTLDSWPSETPGMLVGGPIASDLVKGLPGAGVMPR